MINNLSISYLLIAFVIVCIDSAWGFKNGPWVLVEHLGGTSLFDKIK